MKSLSIKINSLPPRGLRPKRRLWRMQRGRSKAAAQLPWPKGPGNRMPQRGQEVARPVKAVTDEGAISKDVVCSPPRAYLRRAGPMCPAFTRRRILQTVSSVHEACRLCRRGGRLCPPQPRRGMPPPSTARRVVAPYGGADTVCHPSTHGSGYCRVGGRFVKRPYDVNARLPVSP